jgi:hypothetical protein
MSLHKEDYIAFAQAHLQILLTAAAIVVAFFFGYACG